MITKTAEGARAEFTASHVKRLLADPNTICKWVGVDEPRTNLNATEKQIDDSFRAARSNGLLLYNKGKFYALEVPEHFKYTQLKEIPAHRRVKDDLNITDMSVYSNGEYHRI